MKHNSYDESIMDSVLSAARENVREGGGPFAAAVVRDGEVIAIGTNHVTRIPDPTAHGEISAIRQACAKLHTHDLSGCVLYSSCEPCPMCLGAIYWAHIHEVYYCNTRQEAASIGFDDAFIYNELKLAVKDRQVRVTRVVRPDALSAFQAWTDKDDKISY